MKKKILITIIGFTTIGIGYFGLQSFDFTKRENVQYENLNAELNTQTRLFDYPTSDKVEFTIKAKKEFYAGDPIEIKLIWENKSDDTEKIMIKDYLDIQ